MVIALDELGAHDRTEEVANSRFCWGRVLRRRSTGGPTARETSPPPASGQAQVCHRDIALDARAVGSGLGSCLLIEFGSAAIARSRFWGGLRLWGKPVTRQLCRRCLIAPGSLPRTFFDTVNTTPMGTAIARVNWLTPDDGGTGGQQNSIARLSSRNQLGGAGRTVREA